MIDVVQRITETKYIEVQAISILLFTNLTIQYWENHVIHPTLVPVNEATDFSRENILKITFNIPVFNLNFF